MKISDIIYDERIKINDGLPVKLEMRNLERIVILAGPNGAGKTRLLQRICTAHKLKRADHWPPPIHLVFAAPYATESRAPNTRVSVANAAQADEVPIASLGLHFSGWTPDFGFAQVGLFYPTNISDHNFGGKDEEDHIANTFIEQLKAKEDFAYNPGGQTSIQQVYVEIAAIYQFAHAASDEPTRRRAHLAVKEFEEKMRAFIPEKTLHYAEQTNTMMIGPTPDTGKEKNLKDFFPLRKARLSEGEKHFLGYAISMVKRGYLHSSGILCLDEPEHHLHPSAYIKVVRHLIDDVGTEGQIWIATHSVALVAHLLSHYKHEVLLYCMEKGPNETGAEPKQGGRYPSRTIETLMGGMENIDALREMLELPVSWQMVDLTADLFIKSKVVNDDNPRDAQTELTASFFLREEVDEVMEGAFEETTQLAADFYRGVQTSLEAGAQVKVLDYGAGAGRLLRCWRSSQDYDKLKAIDYFAYDVVGDFTPELRNALAAFYSASPKCPDDRFDDRILIGRSSLEGHISVNAHLVLFQTVLMINVLHEISPAFWEKTFVTISKALTKDGSLVVVEDYLMPNAEMNHEWGFLLLNPRSLAILFGLNESQIRVRFPNSEKYRDRIGMSIIPAHAVANISGPRVHAALKEGAKYHSARVKELAKALFYANKRSRVERRDREKISRLYASALIQQNNFERACSDLEETLVGNTKKTQNQNDTKVELIDIKRSEE